MLRNKKRAVIKKKKNKNKNKKTKNKTKRDQVL